MHPVVHGGVPAWYSLSPRNNRFDILVHPEASRRATDFLSQRRMTKGMAAANKVPEFIPPEEGVWGFGPWVKTEEGPEEWVTWSTALPAFTGRNARKRCDQDSGRAAAMTLRMIFEILLISRENCRSRFPQLLTVDSWGANDGPHGNNVTLSVSPELMRWVRERGAQRTATVIKAMKQAFAFMFGGIAPYGESDFRVALESRGWIALACPGDATTIETDGDDRASHMEGDGYELVSHNIENPFWQLTLMMGVAAVIESAREDFKKGDFR